MTVVKEIPVVEVNGNGTKTGYSFQFSYTDPSQIAIWYTPNGGNSRQLATTEYKLTANVPPFAGATVEFLTITPQVTDVIKFSRETTISQDVDFIGTGTVAPIDVEEDFDKIVRILQELYTDFDNVQSVIGKFPSALFQAFGKFMVTNGVNGWDLFPLRFDNPQPSDDSKILLIDIPNQRIRYQSAPSIANPVIPQPVPGSTFKLVGIKDGSYQIGAEIPTFTASDVGSVAIWDGTKYVGVLGTGVSNPTIPLPSSKGLILTSKADTTTEWYDDGFKRIATSSGVVNGVKITKVNNTTVAISSGVLEVVENTTDVPDVKIVNFVGASNVSIPTNVGSSHFLYIDASGTSPSVVVQTTYESLPRGSKIYIGEILHSNNNIITQIHEDYTVVASIPSQLREITTSFFSSKIARTVLLPKATTATSPANQQMKYAAGGIFVGYAVNAANDILNPHVVQGLAGQDPVSFRWRNALDLDSAPQTTLSTTVPLVDNGSGVLTALQNNFFFQALVWISPQGEVIIQYPRTSYANLAAVPSISEFLVKVEKSPSALRNLAPFAVLQMKQGTTFQDVANTFITPISGFSATGISGAQGDRLPFASTADAGKPLVVSPTSNWVVGSYALPAIPAGTAAGKALVTTGATPSLAIDYPIDPVGRTWLSNGILDGFKASYSTGAVLTITAGRALFCTNTAAGEVPSITIVSYPGGTYTITGLASRDLSYIYLNSSGVISDSQSLVTTVRGNLLRLFRVEHFDNVNIEDVQPIYNVLSAIPSQIRDIYNFIGKSIKNFEVTVKTNTALRISSAMFYGFDSGAQANILTPHFFQMPAQDPWSFKFIKSNGDVSTAATDFPLAPSIEGTGGALTTLPVGQVAYYPIWMYQDGSTFVEYARTAYVSGTEPTAADYFLTYKRNASLDEIAVLIGFIKWQNGKNYSNGNSFIPFNAPVSSGSGALPLIQTTSADIGKLVTVTPTGSIGLGVFMPQPKDDGSDAASFSDKVPVYDSTGTFLKLRDFSDVPNLDPASRNLAGSYLVGVKNGRLYALTNKVDFVTPTLHNFSGMEYYLPEPIYVHTSRKGVYVSNFTRNDDGGGLNTPGAHPLKISDVATIKRIAPSESVRFPYDGGFGFVNYGNSNDYYKWLPQNTTYSPLYKALSNEYVVNTPKSSTHSISQTVSVSAGITNFTSISTPDIVDDPNILLVTPFDYTFDLKPWIGASPLGVRYEHDKPSGINRESVNFSRFFVSIFIPPFPRRITGKITVKKVEIKALQDVSDVNSPGTGGNIAYKPEIGLSFFVTSSTALSPTDVLFDMNAGTVPNAVTTYDVNKEFLFDSSTPNFFHDFTNTPDANKNIVFGACIRLTAPIDQNVLQFRGLQSCKITFGVDFSDTLNTTPYSRYEYTTLAAVNSVAAVDGKIWQGDASPLAPNATTGKYNVTLIYAIIHPQAVKTNADFNKDYEGIFVHPLKQQDTPLVFLEDQTGTTKYTERVQFTKRQAKSTLFEVYDIECTADQFNNWKVVLYFTNKIIEATFKTLCDTVGASIWVINRDDFRE